MRKKTEKRSKFDRLPTKQDGGNKYEDQDCVRHGGKEQIVFPLRFETMAAFGKFRLQRSVLSVNVRQFSSIFLQCLQRQIQIIRNNRIRQSRTRIDPTLTHSRHSLHCHTHHTHAYHKYFHSSSDLSVKRDRESSLLTD